MSGVKIRSLAEARRKLRNNWARGSDLEARLEVLEAALLALIYELEEVLDD